MQRIDMDTLRNASLHAENVLFSGYLEICVGKKDATLENVRKHVICMCR